MKRYQPLKGKKIFREVQKKGRRFYGREIQVIAFHFNNNNFDNKRNFSTPAVKMGIQITRKYGNAVYRNRAKRRIRAICHEALGNGTLQGVKENCYIILRPSENFKNLNYADSKRIIISILKKAGIQRSV